MRCPFYELDVLRLNISRAMSLYTSNFLKFFLTFRADYDIIHNVKREAVSNQRNGKLMAPWVTVWKLAHLFN